MKRQAAVVATAFVIASAAGARTQKRTAFLSLNLYDTFDSEPPQPESSRNDLGVSFSIGWSY